MRKPIIAGNWKMNKTIPEAKQLVSGLVSKLAGKSEVEIVFCPPFTALSTVKDLLKGTPYGLGAQDLYWKEKGAFTGEVSPLMLKDVGCDYVIIGHSERRQYFGETDVTVNQKVKAALAVGIKPIICVGETLAQREAGETDALIKGQTEKAFEGIEVSAIPTIVIAYEPIWAIGTGKSSSASDANQVIGLIRNTVAKLYGKETAEQMRIQYGGSVKPENIKEYMSQPEIDGALVGGASLEIDSFLKLIHY
ncbi:MAG TPA: triose-phosphate isomerase [Firmicutes bacterium]|jgi:triosephosphate isomerase (TIM)|nr:triose-phosphate isomerase [Bacillota bacterium]